MDEIEAASGGTVWDWPNQQVVRADQSGPGIGDIDEPGEPPIEGQPLDEMTKAELLDYAKNLGVSPANNDMTKEELRAAIDAKEAEAG